MDKSLGNNAIFVRDEDAALKEMEFRAGCKVLPICAPPDVKPIYYIAEKGGKMYICRPYKQHFVVYERKPRLNNGKTPIYELKLPNDKQCTINIERLVYCTFVLGEYIDKLKVEFKDGNPHNFDVDNLQVRDMLNEDCARRMYGYTDPYERDFERVAHHIAWYIGIDKEDACDIAQEAFISLIAHGRETVAHDFTAIWVLQARELGINMWNKKTRFRSFDYMEREIGRNDVPFGLDILDALKNDDWRKCLELQLQGATLKEIAEETGIKFTNVGSYLVQAKRKLRQFLLTDKEIRKIYA